MNAPPERPKLLVLYDGQCGFCRASAGWLRRQDRRRRLDVQAIPDSGDSLSVRGRTLLRDQLLELMHVVDSRGNVFRGFGAWRRLARETPVLMPVWPFLWLPGVSLAGDLTYRWIARNRSRISHHLRLEPCGDGSCSRGRRR